MYRYKEQAFLLNVELQNSNKKVYIWASVPNLVYKISEIYLFYFHVD